MTSGFELICHHTYSGWSGFAVDLSDHDSDGMPDSQGGADFLNDGVVPGSGAVRFPREKSRLHLRTTSAGWHPLGGLKIEVTVRRGPHLTHAQTLVAGHNSFSFFLANNTLYGSFRCPGKSTHPLQDSDGLNSYTHGLNSQPTYVSQGKWVTLGFFHDGFDTMELTLDGDVVARRTDLLATVPAIGALGATVGNEADRDDYYLNGDIDTLKIWRRDPYIMERQFFSRPMDDATIDCWNRFFASVAKAFERHPDCAARFRALVHETVDRLKRAIVAKGPETRDRFFKTSEEYLALWSTGRLDGSEMEQLFADWCAWLRLSDISIEQDRAIRELRNMECLKRILAEIKPLDCDPQVKALVQIILRGCGRHSAGHHPTSA